MAMRKVFDIVATVGEFKNRDGETKKRYLNCGAVFEDDQGRLSAKLDGVPTGPDWSGWLSFFEPRDRRRDNNADTAGPAQDAPKSDENLPF